MNDGRTIFKQILDNVSLYNFNSCVEKYENNYKSRKLSAWEHYQAMAFAQISQRESLRDIEVSLKSIGKKLYHNGFKNHIKRATLAEANENRDWRIFQELALKQIDHAIKMYEDTKIGLSIKNTIYAFDSSTINLCLSLFTWASFRSTKGGIKLHTLINIRGNIPKSIEITDAKVADVKM